jgi:hypothetical protein
VHAPVDSLLLASRRDQVSNAPVPTPTIDTAIRTQIDQFLTSISHLVRQAAVEAVKDALGATDGRVAAPVQRGPGRPRKVAVAGAAPKATTKAKPGKRARRSAEDVEQVAGQVLAYVHGNPGQRLEEIGRGLGVDTGGLKRPVQHLLATGRLRTEGQKRGTKYFAGGKRGPKLKVAKRAAKKARRKGAKRVGRKAGKKGGRKAAKKAPARTVGKKAGKRGRKAAKVAMTPVEPVVSA